jgi:hypothetical protein
MAGDSWVQRFGAGGCHSDRNAKNRDSNSLSREN